MRKVATAATPPRTKRRTPFAVAVRGEGDIDPCTTQQPEERKAMQHGHRLGGAVRLCEQARQDVGVVFAGERNDHLVTTDIGFVEQVVVGDIALKDKTILELFGKFAGPFGFRSTTTTWTPRLSGSSPGSPPFVRRQAASPASVCALRGRATHHQPSSPSFRHDPDMVAGFEPMITTRNDGLLTSPDRCDHEVPVGFEFLRDVAERPADERRFRRKACPDDDHLSVRHVSNLIGAGEVSSSRTSAAVSPSGSMNRSAPEASRTECAAGPRRPEASSGRSSA